MVEMAETSQDRTEAAAAMQCHCCGALAERVCPLCHVMHCEVCQGDGMKSGSDFIPLGFCPECRSILAEGVSTCRQLAEDNSLRDDARRDADSETGEVQSGKEALEFSLLKLAETSYLAGLSKVPLQATRSIIDATTVLKARLVRMQAQRTPEEAQRVMRGLSSIADSWGKMAYLKRAGEAILVRSDKRVITNLLKNLETALEEFYQDIICAYREEVLSPATRRAVEEQWARLTDLFLESYIRARGNVEVYKNLTAATTHMAELLAVLSTIPDRYQEGIESETVPVIFESLRFKTHLSASYLKRAGLNYPRIIQFLRDLQQEVESRLEKSIAKLTQPIDRPAYRAYLQSSGRAFDLNSRWSEGVAPRDNSLLIEARSWAWTAVCSAHLSGYFAGRLVPIGDLWMTYLLDLDRRIICDGPGKTRITKKGSLDADSALFSIARLLNETTLKSEEVWEGTLYIHTLWHLLNTKEFVSEGRVPDFYLYGITEIKDAFPWFGIYINHVNLLLTKEDAQLLPGEPPQPVGIDEWANLQALKGITISGNGGPLPHGLWVMYGARESDRPPVFGINDLVVDIGNHEEQLQYFNESKGWKMLAGAYSRGGQCQPAVVGLISLLEYGGDRPVAIKCGPREEMDKEFMGASVTLLHDPEWLLVPEDVKQAMDTWMNFHASSRSPLPPPSLFLVNPAFLGLKGLLSRDGKMKNS